MNNKDKPCDRLIEIAHGISEGEEWAIVACEKIASENPLEEE